jgi:hypothetical protein
MMEAALTSETSVDNYFTRQYIPEDNSELHTRRRENLKSHETTYCFILLITVLSVFGGQRAVTTWKETAGGGMKLGNAGK